MADMPTNTTILVVDDTEAGRYAVVRMLQKTGFTVWEAATGDEALRRAAAKPDLVILDVNLPDMTGFEVCRRIKENPETASILVLHLSASMVESENRALGLEGGADGYMIYPVEPRELVANIQALLRIRQAERQASEQRKLLHVTLSSIGDAVIATDTQGVVTFLNPVAETLTGWTQDTAVGQPLAQIFSITDEQTGRPAGNPVEKALRHGMVIGLANHTLLTARDGTTRPVDDSAAPIRDTEGKIVGVVMVFRDVTERRRSDHEIARLMAAERRHSQRLAQVAAASLTINAAGSLESVLRVVTEEARQIIGAHQAITTLSETSHGETATHVLSLSDKYASWTTYCPGAEHSRLLAQVCATNKAIRLTDAELEAIPAWRELAREALPMRGWLAAPLIGRNGKTLGFLQLSDKNEGDFTEEEVHILVQLTQVASVAIENARLYDALRETDRLKDEFLAMLAHELRNPLAPILNAVQVLRIKGSDNPETQWATDVTNRQVQQLTRLVDDLLDLARINRGKINLQKEPLDLAVVVGRAVETSRPLIDSRQHRFELSMPQESVRVEADPMRLAQVFWNLLNNAAKYTPEGGNIQLTVEIEGDGAVVRVKDTGVGITAAMLPKVFDLFTQGGRTLDRSDGGLGIGLTLVRRLTEMHGGSVEAWSEGPGHGSEFVVRLPLLAQTVSPPAAAVSPVPATAPQARRILVVDDNRDSANSLAMLLRLFGNEVQTAYDGKQALVVAGAYQPDVVLLDIGLPGMNGYEVAREMRALPALAHTMLVALTGFGGEQNRRDAREAGFDVHLVKPVELPSLQALLAASPQPSRPEPNP